MKKIKSIKFKLMVGMILLSFCICGITASINSVLLYNTAKQGVNTSVSTAAAAYSVAVQNAIQIYKSNVESMATDDRIKPNATVDEIQAVRDDLKTKYGFSDIIIAKSDGNTFDSETNVADREYFKEAMSGSTYVSGLLQKKTDSSIVIYIAAKISNSTGYNGVIAIELSDDTFSQMIKDVAIGEKGYGFIIDKTGTIVAHKDSVLTKAYTNYKTSAEKDSSYKVMGNFITTMIKNQKGTSEVKFEGSEKYVSYVPISNTNGWILAMAADKTEMMASFTQSIVIAAAVAIFFVLLSCIIAILFAGSIAKPIGVVCRRLQLLSDGDLSSDTVEVRAKDETGVLAESLNKTVLALRSYIEDLSGNLSKMAQGDLCVTRTVEYKGDFKELEKSMVDIVDSFNDVLTQINQASEQVSCGSDQVSNGAQALAQGATEQASSIEELSASIEEISSHIKDNAEHTAHASVNVNQVRSEIQVSNEHMRDMMEAMSQINNSSSEIGKIIQTIEDIAFQTNILALNAAVEAARAGAAGKGFAVVADEVRNLASKSSEAAKNTTALIESSMRQVESGTKIAEETTKSLNMVVEGAKVVSDTMEKISRASNLQSDAIGQVTLGVEQISSVVQTNSATAEESAAASEELSGQAKTMKELVGKFKIRSQEISEDENSSENQDNQLEQPQSEL